jgi:CubicO group peptidase (beta-lactamase class C family)
LGGDGVEALEHADFKRKRAWSHGAAEWSLALVCFFAAALASAASTYDKTFDDVMARYHLPGLALGVIENGRVTYVRTAGELVAGSGRKVTPDTLFKIASNSKAMTTALLARLVQAGKLNWDDPATKYLPQLRMADPWVTQNLLVRDLLVHNIGLREGAGDLMLWPEPNHFTRADIIAGLGYLKPQSSFRSGYAYDNLMYVVAGEVAAAAGGASYESLMRSEVFEPLGLSRCHVGQWRRDDVANVAQPHMRKDGRNVAINEDDDVVPEITSAAAGGIRCSLHDMLTWARNWLVPDAQQLTWLSAEQRRVLWTARTPMPISQRRRDWDHTHFYAYGFGWRLADVDGAWTVSHTGTLSGMYSALILLPDRRSGFVMMTNGEGDEARSVLTEVMLKHFTMGRSPSAPEAMDGREGPQPDGRRGVADYAGELVRESASKPAQRKAPDTSARQPATAAQAQTLLGHWLDPWFGRISICPQDGRVRFEAVKSPLLSGTVMRVGERFLVDWDEDRMDTEAWLQVTPGNPPAAAALAMAKVDPDADFSSDFEDLAFTRERDCD